MSVDRCAQKMPLTAAVYNIDVRARLLLEHITGKKNNWKLMERATEISAEKWRQYGRGSTSVSSAMVEALGKAWPQYAFWLVTGREDVDCGHVSPVQIGDQSADLLAKYTTEFFVVNESLGSAEEQGVTDEIPMLHNRLNFARKKRLQLIARKCSLSNSNT